MKTLIYLIFLPILFCACGKQDTPPKPEANEANEAPKITFVKQCEGSIQNIGLNCPEAKNITLFWLHEAKTKDAVIGIKDGKVYWRSGEWLSGEFHGDVWESGTWVSGKWYGKEWKTGIVNGKEQTTPPISTPDEPKVNLTF